MANARHRQKPLTEAKELGFKFCILKGEETHTINPEDIEIDDLQITYMYEGAEKHVRFSDISTLQILPASRVANIIIKLPLSSKIMLAIIPLFFGMILITIGQSFKEDLGEMWSGGLIGFGVATAIIAYISYFAILKYYTGKQIAMSQRATSGASQLISKLREVSKPGEEEEYFSKLIRINLKNIEGYYSLVKTQTENSFRLTVSGAVVGFLVLVAGIGLSFTQGLDKTPTAITIASGTIIEFISAVLFYLYNKTTQQLNTYHDKLIDVQDTMLALKVGEGIQDAKKKDDIKTYLAQALTSRLNENNSGEQSENAKKT